MRFKLTSLFFLIIAIAAAGCMKDSPKGDPNVGVVVPTGAFGGQFQLVHLNSKSKTDTSYASVLITLNADMSFAVSGDTSKIQAPSKGTFTVDNANSLITFNDLTVTKNTDPNGKKKHLNGPFLYTYTPPTLVIHGASDTLAYYYSLTK
jgi:hypothetical protein